MLILKETKFWSNTVPKNILINCTEKEKKRQEVIFELIQTEKDFVDDMRILIEVYHVWVYLLVVYETITKWSSVI